MLKYFCLLVIVAVLTDCHTHTVAVPGTIWWYCSCDAGLYVCAPDDDFLEAQAMARDCTGRECICSASHSPGACFDEGVTFSASNQEDDGCLP